MNLDVSSMGSVKNDMIPYITIFLAAFPKTVSGVSSFPAVDQKTNWFYLVLGSTFVEQLEHYQ
jgi:hypothetical protein